MESSPLTIGLSFLLLLGFASASCSVDGDWAQSSYNGGQTMRFSGSIDPTSGFVEISVLNPNNDVVYSLPERQITEDFTVNITTKTTFLNGTYKMRASYTKLANGTACSDSLSVPVTLVTNNSKGDLLLNITLNQSVSTQQFSIDGAPVQTDMGTFTTTITGYAIPGLVPSIKLQGTQLAPGSSIGEIALAITQCQTNTDLLTSYQRVADFLASNFTNVLAFQLQNQDLKAQIGDENSGLVKNVKDLQTDKTNLTSQRDSWKANAYSKPDWWAAALIFIPLAFVIFILIQHFAIRGAESEDKPRIRPPVNEVNTHNL